MIKIVEWIFNKLNSETLTFFMLLGVMGCLTLGFFGITTIATEFLLYIEETDFSFIIDISKHCLDLLGLLIFWTIIVCSVLGIILLLLMLLAMIEEKIREKYGK